MYVVKDVGVLGYDLEELSGGVVGGILRGEEEGEDGLGDFIVVEYVE